MMNKEGYSKSQGRGQRHLSHSAVDHATHEEATPVSNGQGRVRPQVRLPLWAMSRPAASPCISSASSVGAAQLPDSQQQRLRGDTKYARRVSQTA